MRAIVLVAGLLLSASALAAPAARNDIGGIMQTLGMGNIADSVVTPMVAQLPGMEGQSAAGQQCAAKQVSTLMREQFQQDIVDALGDDGAALVAEWKQFLATPAGGDMARTFRASAEAATSGKEPADPGLAEATQAKIADFMGKPAFQRFMQGFDGSEPPEDFSQRIVDALQRECKIALDPEQIS